MAAPVCVCDRERDGEAERNRDRDSQRYNCVRETQYVYARLERYFMVATEMEKARERGSEAHRDRERREVEIE